MPKKQPRNSFYFFMLDFKEEGRSKGINYKNMAEVADLAGPVWKNMAPKDRAKYEEMAKKEKQKLNIPELKYTSTGISLAELKRQEMELQEAEQFERDDITSLVQSMVYKTNILTEDIYVMDVNYYCQVKTDYLIGELTLLRFSLKDGVKDVYHQMVNPGKIPIGYASDVKISCTELGLEMPFDDHTRTNMIEVLANIIGYLKKDRPNSQSLPPLFTLPEKVEPIINFIQQLCTRAAEDEGLFRIYKLDYLFFKLMNALKTSSNEGFPKESLALTQLKKDVFKYNPGLGCDAHETADKSIECTSSRTQRWAFTVLDNCCPLAGVDLIAGKHVPREFDMEKILDYNDTKIERPGPSVAGFSAMSSCNSSIVSDFNTSINASTEPKKVQRVHVPLRMPKKDYSQSIRQAPVLSESEFPALTAGRGRTRGRGLAANFDGLNLN